MVVAESVDDHGDQGAGLVGQRDVVGTDVVADDVPVAHRGAQFLQLSAESLIKSMLHDMAFERSDFTGHACLGDDDRCAPVDLAVADEGREVVAAQLSAQLPNCKMPLVRQGQPCVATCPQSAVVATEAEPLLCRRG